MRIPVFLLPYVTIEQRVYIFPHRLARYIPVNTYDADSHGHFILIPPYAQYCSVQARVNVPRIESPYDSPVRGCFSKYLIDTRFTYISVVACTESRQWLLLSGPATSDLIAYERIVTGSKSFTTPANGPAGLLRPLSAYCHAQCLLPSLRRAQRESI